MQFPLVFILQLYLTSRGAWTVRPHTSVSTGYDIHIITAERRTCSSTAEVLTTFQRVLALSVCVCVCVCARVLQSKWPFGKASRVIIVNYSVKLRVLLRGKQSEWAIFSSTSCESSLDTKQTSLTDPGCSQRTQACWVRK